MNHVMHLNTIAGRSALSVVNENGAIATAWLGDVMKMQIQAIIAESEGWPDEAVYKTENHSHTWPMGWSKQKFTNYFATKEELDAYLENCRDWAKCEDNQMIIQVWEWDLGPNLISEVHYG